MNSKSVRYNFDSLPLMDDEAKKYYRKLLKSLQDRGDFWQSDSNLLAVLCQALSDYDRLTRVLLTEGEFYESGSRKYSHPATAARQDALKHIKDISSHFRLAPRFRSKEEKEPGPPDEIDLLMR